MNKKEEFKNFAKSHPELITYLKNNKDMNWQKLYEIYDIYGNDESVWAPYFKNQINNQGITDMLKNIDVKTVQGHIKTAQKALGLIEELTTKGAENIANLKGPSIPRPITKFFGD